MTYTKPRSFVVFDYRRCEHLGKKYRTTDVAIRRFPVLPAAEVEHLFTAHFFDNQSEMRCKNRNTPYDEQGSRDQQQVTRQNNKVNVEHGHIQRTPTSCKHLPHRQYQEDTPSGEEQN